MNEQGKAERKRIRKIAKKWRHVLGLDEWDVTTLYADGTLIVNGALNPEASASATVLWEYRRVTFEFNVQETAKMSDADLEECYVHEAMHALVNELRETEGYMKHEERVATTLAVAFIRTRNSQ